MSIKKELESEEPKQFMKNVDKLVREYLIPAIKSDLVNYYRAIDKKLEQIKQSSNVPEIENIKRELSKHAEAINDIKSGIGRYIFENVKDEQKVNDANDSELEGKDTPPTWYKEEE